METGKLQLTGTQFGLELEYQEKRYDYSARVDHYYDTMRYVVYWFGQGRITDKTSQKANAFLFETQRFNAQYRGGRFYFTDFSRMLFMCRPIAGNEYRGNATYFSLEIATNREKTIDHLCQKIIDPLARSSEEIIRNIVLPRVDLKDLQALGLAPEADGQLRMSESN